MRYPNQVDHCYVLFVMLLVITCMVRTRSKIKLVVGDIRKHVYFIYYAKGENYEDQKEALMKLGTKMPFIHKIYYPYLQVGIT